MNKLLPAVLLSFLLLCSAAKAQVFRNLDFEAAILPAVTNLQEPKFEDLFPGWQPVIPPGDWAAVYYDMVMDSYLCYTLSDIAVDRPYGWAPQIDYFSLELGNIGIPHSAIWRQFHQDG